MSNAQGLSRRDLLVAGGVAGLGGLAAMRGAEAAVVQSSSGPVSGAQYTLHFINNSSNPWDFCIYQKDPGLVTVPGVMSLAWFAQQVAPTTHTQYQWTINYDLVWSQVGTVAPGVIFDASQVRPADIQTPSNNQITLDKVISTSPGYYSFGPQSTGPQGSLVIQCGSNISPADNVLAGIAMSGVGTFVAPTQPNINLTFTPNPQYWVSFGTYVQGQVLSIQEMTNDGQVLFPPNTYTMTAILNSDNTWTIAPTSSSQVSTALKALRAHRMKRA
jgi:hypothetical protein